MLEKKNVTEVGKLKTFRIPGEFAFTKVYNAVPSKNNK